MTLEWYSSESKPIKLLLFGRYFEIMLDRNAVLSYDVPAAIYVLPAVTNARPGKSPQEGENIWALNRK